jgi:hypothetical protein
MLLCHPRVFCVFFPLLSGDEAERIYNRDKQATLSGHFASTMNTVRAVEQRYSWMIGCSNGGADKALLHDWVGASILDWFTIVGGGIGKWVLACLD